MFRYIVSALLSALCVSQVLAANTAPFDPSQFSIIGTITAMTLKAGTSPLRGGVLTVDGIPVVIPDNSIVTLPATAVAWPELFKADGTPDVPGFPNTQWKATVFGNRIQDRYIAGLVYLAQDPVRILQGFVTSINNVNGHFTVAGSFATTTGNIECVLNDPLGVYGPKYTANPLWSVDPVNPSVHATTGFPMCIPRSANDPLCPSKNRPTDPATGRPTTQLTFPSPAQSDANPAGPDPRVMAPIVVGDYITFTGQAITTAAGTQLFEVNGLDVDAGFYTAAGTKPAYINVENVNYGITFPVSPDIPETRAVAFTTDPTTTMQWFAMDVDHCTGEVTERNLLLLIPSAVAPIGRCVFRFGKQDVSPATRNVGFRMSNGVFQTKNNLTAGQFIQPVFNFIFPEFTTFGIQQPPLAFDHIPFLLDGSGPYVPGNVLTPVPATPGPIIGQLNPWPGNKPAPPAVCGPPPTTTASTATPTPTPNPDTVTITSAVSTKSRNGSFTVAVTAKSNNAAAILSLTVAGKAPLPASVMTQNPDGSFSLTVLLKGAPTSVTVTSQFGGSATSAV